MNKEALLELAARWDRDAVTITCQDDSKEAEIQNAVERGVREGKRECADGLRSLIELLG